MEERKASNVDERAVELIHLLNDITNKFFFVQVEMIRKSPLKLSHGEIHTMEVIGSKQTKMKDIASALNITLGTLTVMVDKLVRKGLVTRTRSNVDRRVVLVRLTEKGKKVCSEHRRLGLIFMKRIMGMLDENDMKGFFSALRKIKGMDTDFVKWRM